MTERLPESAWRFARIPGGYETVCDDLGISITADELERKSGELSALLFVRSSMVGLRTIKDGLLKIGKLNFYAPRSRTEWANELRKRCPDEGQALDWEGYLERFVVNVIDAERIGEPSFSLREFVPPPNSGKFLLPRLIGAEETTLWFGDGGSMKSYLMLAAAVALSEGTERVMGMKPTAQTRVGIVDWEWSPGAHHRRLQQLCGADLPDIEYIRAERPIVHEIDRLRRIVREKQLDFIAIDSVLGACDGPPESAEVAGTFFRAVRQIGVPALAIAHRNKGEDGDKKPFGSAFWHNFARISWFIEKSQETAQSTNIALHNRKNNDGPDMQSEGFTFHFDTMGLRTVISPSSVADDPVLSEKLPVRDRMVAALRIGPLAQHELAEELGVPLNTIIQTIKRDEQRPEGRVFGRMEGIDRVMRVSLLAPVARA